MRTPFNLTGRRALVTGATRGIGLAAAEALAAAGCAVAITGRKEENLAPAVAQLRQIGDARGVVCHQGEAASIERLFAQLDHAEFTPDIAVINAATNPVYGPLIELDAGAWQKILEVNLTGAFLTARAAIRRMLPRKKGVVLFMASVAGIEPMSGLGGYSVSKAGLLGLMRALACELGFAGIRVNALAPGLVETKFSQALFDHKPAYDSIISKVPLKRHAVPEDIAGAVVFLASDAASYITGQTLLIDGGLRV